jgi:stage II sporulation protein M
MGRIRNIWSMVAAEIGRSKFYILAAAILFGFGIYSGYSSDEFDEVLSKATAQVFGEVRERITQSDNPTLTSIWLIFLNNVRAVFFMMALGLLLAIMPIISMLLNGILIGFVLRLQEASGLSVAELIFKGLLPHGLLEMPAIIIGAGYGIRLGVTLILRLFPSMRTNLQTIREAALSGVPLFGFLVVLLFFAAIIESTLTAFLLLG